MEERNSASPVSWAEQTGERNLQEPPTPTPPPTGREVVPQQTESCGAGLGVAHFKAPQDTPRDHLTKLPKGLESGSDHLLHALVE